MEIEKRESERKGKIAVDEKQFTVLSLFCGCGGFDLGFERAGFEILWANDNDHFACSTYKNHFPTVNLIKKDIRAIKKFKTSKEVDVVIGGYPCQGFSEANRNRRLDDERNFLYREFGRCLKTVKPKMFVAENVQGLLNMGNGTVIKQMVKEFEEKNFKVTYKLLNAKDYGVPQERKRVFIVGVRTDLDLQFKFPESTFGSRSNPHRTLKNAIWKYRDSPGNYYQGKRNDRFMTRQHKKPWHKPSYCVVATAWNVPLHPDGKLMKPTHWDEFGRGDRFVFVGDSNRTLSVKECLVIQTFPENFKLEGDLISQYRQVGNAIPPQLSLALATAVRRCLDGIKISYCDHGCSLDQKPVKTIVFRDKKGSVLLINLCSSCFEDQFHISWRQHDPKDILFLPS